MKASPVCTFDGENWIPGPLAKGPFAGLHGGVAAGLVTAAMEQKAADLGAGAGLQVSVSMLRPTPMAPLGVSVRVLRQGKRSLQLSAELTADGKTYAVGSALFLSELPLEFADSETPGSMEPAGDPFDIRHPVDGAWFFDACEMKREADGRIWLRHRNPVVENMCGLTHVISLADWGTGFSRPDWVDRNGVVFPNPEISVHLHRPPVGAWLAVKSAPNWNASGIGLTTSELYDMQGYLGRAAQPVVLAVLE